MALVACDDTSTRRQERPPPPRSRDFRSALAASTGWHGGQQRWWFGGTPRGKGRTMRRSQDDTGRHREGWDTAADDGCPSKLAASTGWCASHMC